MKKLPAVLLTLLLMCSAFMPFTLNAAELKVATVDLEKIFRNYYRTKIIDQDITEQGKVYRNYIARQAELLRKDEAIYREKRNASLNVALNPAERQKRQLEAQELEKSLKMRRAELEQYASDRAKALQELAAKERLKVIDEIRSEIRRRAVLEGYTLVLDVSGRSINDTALVLYSAEALDITEKILTELNRGAKKSADNNGKK